jgi:protein-S-isoprenylcysteine O-methyltransferase Ste14
VASKNGGDSSIVFSLRKLAVFTVLVPGTVTVWLPLFVLCPTIRGQAIEWNATAGGGILAIANGAGGSLGCVLDFACRGKGTPALIDMPKVLLVRGQYRFARNPMCASVPCVLLGESFLFWSATRLRYAAVVAVMFHLLVLLLEEPARKTEMGPTYEQYCNEVRRWIPRITQRRRSDAL